MTRRQKLDEKLRVEVIGETLPARIRGSGTARAHARVLGRIDRAGGPKDHRIEPVEQREGGGAAVRGNPAPACSRGAGTTANPAR